MLNQAVGIVGLATLLPTHIRRNDYWSDELVEKWTQGAHRRLKGLLEVASGGGLNPRQLLTVQAFSAIGADPFGGAQQRRIFDRNHKPWEMEAEVGAAALEDANVAKEAVDALLVHCIAPEFVTTSTGCKSHQLMGLNRNVMTIQVDNACNSFALQLAMAASLVRSGAARNVLCIQSSPITRIMPKAAGYTANFGDAASAVVVSRVPADQGLLSAAHRTLGEQYYAVGCSPKDRGQFWYEGGDAKWRVIDRTGTMDMLLGMGDCALEVTSDALAQAALRPDEVDAFASHQGQSWIGDVAHKAAGLQHARTSHTHAFAGSVAASNLPLVMQTMRENGQLNCGDLLTTFSGGTGASFNSTVMRWCIN